MNSTTIPRCKVGDWALVIKPDYPENAGRVVRIVRQSGPDECYDFEAGCTVWLVRSDGGPLRGKVLDVETGAITTELESERCMDDERLLPIWWETRHDVETAALIAGIRERARHAA